TATAVTVRMTPEPSAPTWRPTGVRYGPTTVVDPARVAKVAALFNTARMTLPVRFMSCPIAFVDGGRMTLTFTNADGRAVATAGIGLNGGRGLAVQVTGGSSAGMEGGESTADAVIDVLGLGWPHQGR